MARKGHRHEGAGASKACTGDGRARYGMVSTTTLRPAAVFLSGFGRVLKFKFKCMISAMYVRTRSMPSITITISEEAYKVLKAAKKDNESFSDVILRLFPRGHPRRILAYLHDHKPLDKETAESIREASRELRRNFKAYVPEI